MNEAAAAPAAPPIRITAPGLYPDVPSAQYRTAAITPTPALSAGMAHDMMKEDGSPALAWFKSDLNPNRVDETKAAWDIGQALHLLFLEPDRFDATVMEIGFDEYRTNAAKDARQRARDLGRVPLLEPQYLMVLAMRRALMNECSELPFLTAPTFAREGIRGGVAEQSCFWKDPRTGIWCKSRPDYTRQGVRGADILVDYKSSGEVDTDRQAYKLGWHSRAAWYIDGHMAVTGNRAEYWYLPQKKKPPHFARVIRMSEDALDWGRTVNARAIETFDRCLQSGKWPAGNERAEVLDLPKWAIGELQGRHDRGDFETHRSDDDEGDE